MRLDMMHIKLDWSFWDWIKLYKIKICLIPWLTEQNYSILFLKLLLMEKTFSEILFTNSIFTKIMIKKKSESFLKNNLILFIDMWLLIKKPSTLFAWNSILIYLDWKRKKNLMNWSRKLMTLNSNFPIMKKWLRIK